MSLSLFAFYRILLRLRIRNSSERSNILTFEPLISSEKKNVEKKWSTKLNSFRYVLFCFADNNDQDLSTGLMTVQRKDQLMIHQQTLKIRRILRGKQEQLIQKKKNQTIRRQKHLKLQLNWISLSWNDFLAPSKCI